MRQLTALDAQFLALETPRQYGHVAGVAILDPSTAPGGKLELADLQDLIVERLALVPPLRWRLAEVPLGLDYGYWIDDPDFDLEYHVRELALPAPGTYAKLADQVARIIARPPRSRVRGRSAASPGRCSGRSAAEATSTSTATTSSRPRRRSTGASRRTGASCSARSPSTTSRRPRTSTGARSTT